MARRWVGIGVFLGVLGLVAGLAQLATRERDIPASPPAGAPAEGSCWQVDEGAARGAFPWPGRPVDCTKTHTAEVYEVGQVDEALIRGADDDGDDETKRVAESLMYAQARRGCLAAATTYLGAAWHGGRVQVIADWIKPARDGFYGCALAETADPAGTTFVGRQGSLRAGLAADGPLAASCVSRGDGDALRYTMCDQPHDGEYVGSYAVTPLDVPFDADGVKSAADRGCTQVGLGFLGLPAGGTRPDLRVGYVGPTTADDWLGSDQAFACYLMVVEGRVRGSVKSLGPAPLPR